MSNFIQVFERVLGHEGGYVNDPADPGGETKFGISKRSYPSVDIKNLTIEQAIVIYRNDFWNKIDGDQLPFSIAYQLFDFAVNSGTQTAIRYLQRAIGVADDGHWGPHSRTSMDEFLSTRGENDLIMRFIAERQLFQTRLKNWKDHGKGWAVRNAMNLRMGAEDSLS